MLGPGREVLLRRTGLEKEIANLVKFIQLLFAIPLSEKKSAA